MSGDNGDSEDSSPTRGLGASPLLESTEGSPTAYFSPILTPMTTTKSGSSSSPHSFATPPTSDHSPPTFLLHKATSRLLTASSIAADSDDGDSGGEPPPSANALQDRKSHKKIMPDGSAPDPNISYDEQHQREWWRKMLFWSELVFIIAVKMWTQGGNQALSTDKAFIKTDPDTGFNLAGNIPFWATTTMASASASLIPITRCRPLYNRMSKSLQTKHRGPVTLDKNYPPPRKGGDMHFLEAFLMFASFASTLFIGLRGFIGGYYLMNKLIQNQLISVFTGAVTSIVGARLFFIFSAALTQRSARVIAEQIKEYYTHRPTLNFRTKLSVFMLIWASFYYGTIAYFSTKNAIEGLAFGILSDPTIFLLSRIFAVISSLLAFSNTAGSRYEGFSDLFEKGPRGMFKNTYTPKTKGDIAKAIIMLAIMGLSVPGFIGLSSISATHTLILDFIIRGHDHLSSIFRLLLDGLFLIPATISTFTFVFARAWIAEFGIEKNEDSARKSIRIC